MRIKHRQKHTFFNSLFDSLIEHMVPDNHRLRKLFKDLDFSFVNDLCGKYYKNDWNGAPAESPERIFRMLFLMIYEGIHGETRLAERVSTDASYRLFCRFSLSEKVPDHSTLWVFRKRLGEEGFLEIFEAILQQCIDHDFIGGKSLMYDCTNTIAFGTPYSKQKRAGILAKAILMRLNESPDSQSGSVKKIEISPEILTLVSQVASEEIDYKRPKSVEKKLVEDDSILVLPLDGKNEEGTSEGLNPVSAGRSDEASVEIHPDPEDDPGNGGGDKPTSLPEKSDLKALAKEIVGTLPQTDGDPDARMGFIPDCDQNFAYRDGDIPPTNERKVFLNASLIAN